jgi:hypothetical protein
MGSTSKLYLFVGFYLILFLEIFKESAPFSVFFCVSIQVGTSEFLE